MQEMMKYMKAHGQGIIASNDASCVSYTGFAGMLSYCYSNAFKIKNMGKWIVDTGVAAYMCNDLSLFSSCRVLTKSNFITSPDGSMKSITKIGTVFFNQNLQLSNVLYIPTFRHNLLFVSQITQTNKVSVHFFHDKCLLHDIATKGMLAIGRML